MFMDTMGQSSSSQQPNVTRISSFATWMKAWNLYLSVLLNNNPGRALELVGYQQLICSANKLPIKCYLLQQQQIEVNGQTSIWVGLGRC